MTRIWLHDAILLDPDAAEPAAGCLLLEGDRILAKAPPSAPPPEGAKRVSLSGQALAPGFLDLHYHGRLIFTPPEAAAAELARAARRLVRHGVTGFLPTTIAWAAPTLMTQVSAWAKACDARHEPGQAARLGLHLEGPWIRPEAAGAQPKAGICPFEPAFGAELLDRGEGTIRMVTLAPEAEGSLSLQAELARRGVVASLGHSHADAALTTDAIEAGATHVTHLFNAMGPLHHRTPGLAGIALSDDRLSCDLICDGVHVDPAVVKLAARAKGERLSLITDRVEPVDDAPAARHDPGLELGMAPDDGRALRLPDGTLAGSRLRLDQAVRNAISFGAMTRQQAIQAVTLRPAKVLGLEAERGSFRKGARADLVVLDETNHVTETWLAGARV